MSSGPTAAPWALVTPISSPQERFSVPIKDDHRMTAARENVDVVLAVDADGSAVAIGIAGGQFAPVADNLIPVFSISENDRGGRSASRLRALCGANGAEGSGCCGCGEACEELSTRHRTKVAHGHLPAMSLLRIHGRKPPVRRHHRSARTSADPRMRRIYSRRRATNPVQ
jgi:hypothetical protein